jgi:hypothetical protein
MSYYLAPALAVLRDEINARWPDRDQASDGWIGDTAHQGTRSDHNPNDRGSVNALDIDRDGVDMAAIIAAIEAHPSAHYWIYREQIADRDDGWRRRPYTGSNPHDKHLHVSIRQSRTAEQDQRPWGLLEDTMPLNNADLGKIRTATAEGFYDALVVAMTGRPHRDVTYSGPGSIGASVRENFAGLVRLGVLAALAGQDLTDEEQIVSGVLAGLGGRSPADVAAALVAAGIDPAVLAAELTRIAGAGT